MSGETLRHDLQGAADSRSVFICGHTVAVWIDDVTFYDYFFLYFNDCYVP